MIMPTIANLLRLFARQHDVAASNSGRLLPVRLMLCLVSLSGGAYVQIVLPGPGIINTLAGNGTAGFSGDGGAATSAELNNPRGVAVDTAGNIYIADDVNNRVRKVTASNGLASSVAGDGTQGYSGDGGAATSAELNTPFGVCVDAAGNIYVADTGNNRVRKVTVSTGVISTVAGDATQGYSGDGGSATSAELNNPTGVGVDAAGNIYIADEGNNRIRKVTVSSGIISTVAGNGSAGYSGNGGAATSAELNSPEGLALDSASNIYIADNFNNVIREVTVSTGVISTVAGNGTVGFSGDGGSATSAELDAPSGVAVDAFGALYIADYGNDRIRKVASGIIHTIAGDGSGGYSGDGGAATSAELYDPYGVAVDNQGNTYIADTFNNRIRGVGNVLGLPRPGDINTIAGNGTAGYSGDGGAAITAEVSEAQGVWVSSTGNIYIADTQNDRIRKVAGSTGVITTVAGNGAGGYSGDGGAATSAEIGGPFGVTTDGAGNIYIADWGNNCVRKVTASTGIISTVAGDGTGDGGYNGDGIPATSAKLAAPYGVAVDSAGNIYIADLGNQRIRKVTVATGIISTVAGNGTRGYSGDGGAATGAEFFDPDGVALDAAGNIYIPDHFNNRIRKVTVATGIISTVAGDGTKGYSGDGGAATSSELSYPSGVAVDTAGNIYISDQTNNRIRKVTVATGIISTVAGNGTLGYSGDGGTATSAEMAWQFGVAVDTVGNIYIADFKNNRIRVVVP